MRIVLFLLVLMAAPVLSQGPSPTPPEGARPPQERTAEAGTKTEYDQRGTKDSPLAVELMNTGKTADERAHEAEAEEGKATRERVLNVLTGIAAGGSALLVIVTGALAFFTWKLWRATGDLVRDAGKTAKRQLRAYVSVDTGTATNARGEPILNQVLVELQNDGQTPAHQLSQWTAFVVREFPLTSPLTEPEVTEQQTRTILNPGRKRAVLFDYPVEQLRASEAAIQRGEMALYVWGRVTYKDVFEEDHATSFVFFQNREGLRFHRFGHYAEGNDAS